MSQLSESSGVAVATIKYYLREGLLPAGVATSANQASYSDEHVARLRLIRALIEVGGLPVATARSVLQAIDTPNMPLSYVFGVAQYAVSYASIYDPIESSEGTATVAALLAQRGWLVCADNPGLRGAARVLDAYRRTGHPDLAVIPDGYAEASESIARADLAFVAGQPDVATMTETVVVGTVLGDALLASLRRMAQEHVSYQLFPAPRGEEGTHS
jgi:DNA-binding transcriptional MerR regulator